MQNKYTTKIIEKYTKDLKELSKLSTDQLLVEVLESFFKIERKEYLEESHINKGNGFYSRIFQGLSRNGLEIKIPRTRISDFRPALLEIVKRDEEMVKDFALDLYITGLSSRDTKKVLGKYFSKEMSHTKIVELANQYQKLREEWEERTLEAYFKVIFVDAIHIPLRRGDTYTQEAVSIIYGVREDNRREVLYFNVTPNESSVNYQEIFEKLNEQGLKKVDLIIGDGLKGLPDAVHKVYPKSDFQLCTVHKKRNVLNKIRTKEKAEVAADLKYVFGLFAKDEDAKEGNRRLDVFILKWKKIYPRIGVHFKDSREYLFTYTKYDPEIRRYIYTTNSSENLNSVVRKSVRNKYSFKSETSILNYLFLVLMDFQENKLARYEVNQFRNFRKLNTQTHFS